MDLTSHTIAQLLEGYRAKRFSATEVTRAYLDRIKALEPKVHAFLHVAEDRAVADAAAADASYKKGDAGALAGIPIALKDVFATKGIPTTGGSKILEGYVPPMDATCVRLLTEAGMVLLGKTNLDEFTMGTSTENSAYGPSRNPWNLDCVPGGSSGGSAAAVAAHFAAGAFGTDTGGSVRQPAGLTSTVGIRPTYGRVSRRGVFSMASSLDTIGPFGRDVRDTALLLQAVAGHDRDDTTTPDVPVPDYTANLDGAIKKGLKIGVPKDVRAADYHPGVKAAFEESLRAYEALGATIHEVDLHSNEHALAVYYLVNTAEVSANMSRFDGIRFGPSVKAEDLHELYIQNRSAGFGQEVKRRIMLGTFVLSHGYKDAYYGKAQKVRTLIAREHDEAFKTVDVIAMPTSPVPAFKLGEKADDPLALYLADIFTVPSVLVGIPGISIPCGFVDGLPVGLQLLSPQFTEPLLFQTAHAYEQANVWHTRTAPLS